MKVSLGSPDPDDTSGGFVAGQEYDLPKAKADELIVKGYAEGNLSREFSDDERGQIVGATQITGPGA